MRCKTKMCILYHKLRLAFVISESIIFMEDDHQPACREPRSGEILIFVSKKKPNNAVSPQSVSGRIVRVQSQTSCMASQYCLGIFSETNLKILWDSGALFIYIYVHYIIYLWYIRSVNLQSLMWKHQVFYFLKPFLLFWGHVVHTHWLLLASEGMYNGYGA